MVELRDWTTEKPSEPGWYGYLPSKTEHDLLISQRWYMVHLYESVSGLAARIQDSLISWRLIKDLDGQWAGPIRMIDD